MALVSIIIPHFNRAALLAETLESVRGQTHENWEIVIVDDGSDDGEWTAIQTFADDGIRILRRTDGEKGPSRCRNLGVAGSHGDFLMFLDSDDLLAPWCLARRLEFAEAAPKNDFWVFPVMLFEEEAGDLPVCWNRLEGEVDLERFLRSDPPWHTSSPLWRREAFDWTGGFNEAVMYGDDADLHARALLKGAVYVKYPEELPDVFIRRSAAGRITNSLNPELLRSRLTRLKEGGKALREVGAGVELLRIWEGQYFVEGEFLLFNEEHPQASVQEVINAWNAECRPSFFRRLFVATYFRAAMNTRDRMYLILRLFRRLCMLVLPKDYFPRGGVFHSHEVEMVLANEIRRKLGCKTPELIQ